MLKILAIIPARGGSKGVPKKNLRYLGGQPLIAHTIIQASKVKLVNRVVVSSDNVEIMNVSESYGVDAIERPKEISGDKSSSEDALLHVLDKLRMSEDYEPDIIVFLQCTSPLRTAEDIDNAIIKLLKSRADSLVGVSPFNLFLWRTKFGQPEGINHNMYERKMRQDIDNQYIETGALYVMRTKGFLKAKHRFFGKTVLFEMPAERCLDINTEADFKIAEALL